MGPHNGGCGTCTGLVTVHNGDWRSGQVDYTVEYYTMGHLTKFVKPGAVRIDSNANSTVRNVAWKNPDGSKALIAYNTSGSAQTVKVNWGGSPRSATACPTTTSATFTWGGTQGGGWPPGWRHRLDHRSGRQVPGRDRRIDAPTATCLQLYAAPAGPDRTGPSAPTTRSARSASAWT